MPIFPGFRITQCTVSGQRRQRLAVSLFSPTRYVLQRFARSYKWLHWLHRGFWKHQGFQQSKTRVTVFIYAVKQIFYAYRRGNIRNFLQYPSIPHYYCTMQPILQYHCNIYFILQEYYSLLSIVEYYCNICTILQYFLQYIYDSQYHRNIRYCNKLNWNLLHPTLA